ncbi:MAG: DNA mismatch repair protein MutS, partial [Bacteroidales bacterium]|nr:DNA mismatch repair protein MutS [Bacteroidales bacterium]
ITLTRRANGSASSVELAGFPWHALDTYLPKLVRAGQRVAICEQLEDPKLTKKIVKRGITELITPGVSFSDNVLNHKENNFLAAIHIDKQAVGVALLDVSTGEFFVTEGDTPHVEQVLNNFQPREVLFEKRKSELFRERFGSRFYTYKLDDWIFTPETATERLLKQFGTTSLKGFGIHGLPHGIVAAGAILYYLDMTRHENLGHINRISRIEEEKYVWLDRFTVRNLELFHSPYEGAKTLIDIVDRTLSPMGGRMMKRWISLPLKDTAVLNTRLDIVEFLIRDKGISEAMEGLIREVGDLERLLSKAAVGRVTPSEIIGRTLTPDPPVAINKGQVIAEGISQELDELRNIFYGGKDYLNDLQQRESIRTGITSLKISYNNVFGYYIEVRNTHKDKVPADWIRKQTLVSAERYITEELKEYESKILGAGEKILALETSLFNDLVLSLTPYIALMQADAAAVGRLDCLRSFAVISDEYGYSRPALDDSHVLDIRDGRHPVIERQLPPDDPYVPNDVWLDNDKQQVIILTGPNMSGKSALLRQTALIVIMAQAGCFVPAREARIGIIDKIFTRVGASDNLSLGESTFMVEMNEAASILNNLTDRSLILLDEIGRGTSTYDGISIAWAMVEYIHEYRHKAKTLFATHYHELNEMENTFARVKNYNVSIRELDNRVIFLRKLKRGGSEHSFGIHVARMAGMPKSVVGRANEILKLLEEGRGGNNLGKPVDEIDVHREGYQLSIYQLDDPVLKQIRDELMGLDLDNLTPMEALNKLYNIRKLLK